MNRLDVDGLRRLGPRCFTWNVNIKDLFRRSAAGHVVVVFPLIRQLLSISVPRGTANRAGWVR